MVLRLHEGEIGKATRYKTSLPPFLNTDTWVNNFSSLGGVLETMAQEPSRDNGPETLYIRCRPFVPTHLSTPNIDDSNRWCDLLRQARLEFQKLWALASQCVFSEKNSLEKMSLLPFHCKLLMFDSGGEIGWGKSSFERQDSGLSLSFYLETMQSLTWIFLDD